MFVFYLSLGRFVEVFLFTGLFKKVMIVIDKSLPTNKVILTLREKAVDATDSTVYVLKLHSYETNADHIVNAGVSVSAYPKRYDELNISQSELTNVTPGVFVYEVHETIEGEVQAQIFQVGLVKIIDSEAIEAEEDEVISIEENPDEDDYITMDY